MATRSRRSHAWDEFVIAPTTFTCRVAAGASVPEPAHRRIDVDIPGPSLQATGHCPADHPVRNIKVGGKDASNRRPASG